MRDSDTPNSTAHHHISPETQREMDCSGEWIWLRYKLHLWIRSGVIMLKTDVISALIYVKLQVHLLQQQGLEFNLSLW